MSLTEFLYEMDDARKKEIELNLDNWLKQNSRSYTSAADKYYDAVKFNPSKEEKIYLRLRLIDEIEKEGGYCNFGTACLECCKMVDDPSIGFWLKNELKKKWKNFYQRAEEEHPILTILTILFTNNFIGFLLGMVPHDLEEKYEKLIEKELDL